MDNILSILSDYASNTSSPVLMVIILGIIFALDPCLLLTNIAAIGYISKDINNNKQSFVCGLWYTLGRTICYGLLGVVLILLLQAGTNISGFENFFEKWGTIIVTVFMVLMGIFLCLSDYIKLPQINIVKNINHTSFHGSIGAFLLGAILTMAFCPTNAILFFGMMVPVCVVSPFGYLLPFIFAATTAIPIIITSYIIAFSLNSIGKYYEKLKQISKFMKIFVGVIFIIFGIIMGIQQYLGEGHHSHHHHEHNTECTEHHCEGEVHHCDEHSESHDCDEHTHDLE